jgi:hypothetical protein
MAYRIFVWLAVAGGIYCGILAFEKGFENDMQGQELERANLESFDRTHRYLIMKENRRHGR